MIRKGDDPPAGHASPHVAAGGSPDRTALGEEERAFISGVLRQASIKPTKEILGRLIDAVQGSMAAFRQAASQGTRREHHDALRAVVCMAEEADPPVGMIRARIAKLAVVDVADAEARARRLWPRVFPGKRLESGLVAWSETAPEAELLDAVRTFFSDGGVVVQGRARQGGKHSKSRLEPRILGQARGAASPSRAKAEAPAGSPESQPPSPSNGRPRAEAADRLVLDLAWGWVVVTGLELQPGRSDRTPFGALVHHVFGWLGIETAEQSLRRYWDEVRDAEIIDIEGGQVFR